MSVYSNKVTVYHYGDVVRIIFEDCTRDTEGTVVANVVLRSRDSDALAEILNRHIQEKRQLS